MVSGLYFVVDGSGNYYRVNSNNQLVAVESRENAGVFSFAEANQKIGGGKKSQFYSVIPVEEKNGAESGFSAQAEPAQEPERKFVAKKEQDFVYDMRNTNWEEYLAYFCYLASGAMDYQEELKQAISDLDLQICDIMHCIELHDLDESDSIRMIELLKECREQRRDVKDEMVRVEYFQKTIGTSANVAKVKDGIKQIKKLSTRIYHPRKLPEIFKDRAKGAARQDKLQRAMDDTTCMDYIVAETFYEAESVMEEETMEYTKQDTVFDGKKNNWLDFARQQEAFYANAEQYLVNLQIRQDELQEELEQVLEEVENANYNVTQGYNVYKRLKELQNEKKNLQKELEAMYILTYGINCGKAAEDMAACVRELEELYPKQAGEGTMYDAELEGQMVLEPVLHEVKIAG